MNARKAPTVTTSNGVASNGHSNMMAMHNGNIRHGSNGVPGNSIGKHGDYGGLKRMLPHIGGYMALLLAVYYGLYYTLAHANDIGGLVPAEQYCDDNKAAPCRRPDLFAFQMASAVAMYTSALLGIHAWYVTRRPHTDMPAAHTPQGRLLAHMPEAERLAAYALAYQLFDLIISVTIPEHCTVIMMTHHTMAALVAYCSIRYTVLHYYSFFFLGLSEVSTLFLVWMDLATFFPPPPDTWFGIFIDTVAGPGFVVTFICYRVVQWWPMSLQLFRDVRHVVAQTNLFRTLRPQQGPWVLYVFLACNLPLGILQLYWLTIILGEVQKTLMGEE